MTNMVDILRQTAEHLPPCSGCGKAFRPADGFGEAFVFVCSGRGEVQITEDGLAMWMRWDRTNAVTDEVELDLPASRNPSILAMWMLEMAGRYADR